MSHDSDSIRRFGPPPSQTNYRRATEAAFEMLRRQSDEQLRWLGAEPSKNAWRLPILGDVFEVDISSGRVSTVAGREVGVAWRVLALHYLAIASQPERRVPDTTFADLSASRAYAGVYHGRVIGRLLGTVGRRKESLCQAATAIGGCVTSGGDAAFDFDEFPQLSLRLIWHAADDEFPPSATLLLPSNIESYFCAEDIVVASECLVARLSGRPF